VTRECFKSSFEVKVSSHKLMHPRSSIEARGWRP